MEVTASLAELLEEREHLLEIAQWRFGSRATAEQVVQETYRRWYALAPAERDVVEPRSWLTHLASTINPDGFEPVDPLVHRFALACTTGDVPGVRATLASDATLVTDTGGHLRTTPHPVRGADEVASYAARLLTRHPGCHLTTEPVNGHPGLILRQTTQAIAVISLTTTPTEIETVYIVLNPSKLTPWHRT
ncbi:hypothetical protein [Kribbella sp. CA-247076]|uniref:hypothetical protein n=1 Tax=Kribbella sp. CA-247076 TaxID=3239941 RepID=UPI003D89E4FF